MFLNNIVTFGCVVSKLRPPYNIPFINRYHFSFDKRNIVWLREGNPKKQSWDGKKVYFGYQKD